MAYFTLIDCRIKIQICVGHFPDGRMRTRTFGIKGVRPGASADDVAAVTRAIGELLAYPIMRVRLVKKYLLINICNNDEADDLRDYASLHPKLRASVSHTGATTLDICIPQDTIFS